MKEIVRPRHGGNSAGAVYMAALRVACSINSLYIPSSFHHCNKICVYVVVRSKKIQTGWYFSLDRYSVLSGKPIHMDHNPGVTSGDVKKLDLEIRELELKVKELLFKLRDLERPPYKKLSFWTNVITVLIAIIGIAGQSIYSNIKSERAELRLDEANKKAEEANKKKEEAEKDMKVSILRKESTDRERLSLEKTIKDSTAALERITANAKKALAEAETKRATVEGQLQLALKEYTNILSGVAYNKAQPANSGSTTSAATTNNPKLTALLLSNNSGALLKNSILKIYFLPPQKEKAQQINNILKTNGASSDFLPPAYSISDVKRNEIVYYNDPQLVYCKAVQQLLKQEGLGDFSIRKSSGANTTISYFKMYLVK